MQQLKKYYQNKLFGGSLFVTSLKIPRISDYITNADRKLEILDPRGRREMQQ